MKRVLLCVCVLLAGCGSRSPEEYMPQGEGAKQAVQAALEAWKSAKPFSPVPDSKPPINVFDARWRDGKKLETFEVGDPVAGAAPPRVPVKMKLVGGVEETVHYVVVGIDPLNVFRDADYERAAGM